jgi:hypothetical protein
MGTSLNNFLEFAALGAFLITPGVEAAAQGRRRDAPNLYPITHD